MSEQKKHTTREQIAELLWSSAADDNYDPRWTWAYLTELADRSEGDYSEIRAEYYSTADAVLALFPQPTPSACICGPQSVISDGPNTDCPAHGEQPTPSAEHGDDWKCGRCGGSPFEHSRSESTCIWEPVPNEPTVQVPVSLIERTAAEYEREGWPLAAQKWRTLLLPQSPPSAEPCTECQYVEGHRDDCERLDDYLAHRDDTTPRSIADMAPGTTFLGEKFEPRYLSRWTVLVRGQIMSGMGVPHNAFEIDPSTIRDVTAPESPNVN